MSMPASTCCRTTSLTPARTSSARVASSYGCPIVFAFMPRMISRVRTRLPLCVVRMRSVLRCMLFLASHHRGPPQDVGVRLLVLGAHRVTAAALPLADDLVKLAQRRG